jgi:hypothetical protein
MRITTTATLLKWINPKARYVLYTGSQSGGYSLIDEIQFEPDKGWDEPSRSADVYWAETAGYGECARRTLDALPCHLHDALWVRGSTLRAALRTARKQLNMQRTTSR